MSARLTKIEGLLLEDHTHLTGEDQCYCFHEYTSGKNFDFSTANSIISNLKKKPSAKARPDVWKHKLRTIDACAKSIGELLNPDFLKKSTLVPIPPSKAASDPEYDDRMLAMLQKISIGSPLDIRELVYQTKSLPASHEAGDGQRLTVTDLLGVYRINETLTTPPPKTIAIFDDVMTAGTHYRAMSTVLSQRFPSARIFGFFVARRTFPPVEF